MAQSRAGGMVISFRYEPLEFMLKTGLSELSLECFEQMNDGFYQEIFSPDWALYKEQEDRKDLGFVAMRDGDKLVGYAVLKIMTDIHQKEERIALLHDIYIKDEYRGRATSFFHFLEQFVQQMGAGWMDVAERLSFDANRGGSGKFYSYMGYRPMEVIYRKRLGREGTA